MSTLIIDCARKENYAVAILDNNNYLDYFSFESQAKKTIKSNIYLGRITRVEHSLQAAFVDYGGEHAGFLPFSEIHPNYYQLPIKDKQELLDALRAEEENCEDDENENNENNNDNDNQSENNEENNNDNKKENKDKAKIAYRIYKKYNIQEVIKRGQTVLVQVFKDERGNKGASLTTYISLPGRYCVLMPNSPRGIGVSKKIFAYEDRKRILNTVRNFGIPYGTGLIVRTAGAKASIEELEKDYEYLIELWNNIRDKAIHSKVGSGNSIYEEVNIVKQIIRDNYESDNNSSIVINRKEEYDEIIEFIKSIMPNEVSKVVLYTEKTPIFKKFGINKKLNDLLDPVAPLPSGGYLVINPTEALVSIDVNSGKSIQGKNVEETALATNLDAAREVARQLRLRNLGGLIVVDFIDMDKLENRRTLERELQKVFLTDKAKVQCTKISQFGLVEISRQRMRSSIAEMLTVKCEHCNGIGLVKSPAIIAVDIFNSIEEKLSDLGANKKEFLEIIASEKNVEYIVANGKKEIEHIQRKFNVKIIATERYFKHEEEFILRSLDNINDKDMATEICHVISEKKDNRHCCDNYDNHSYNNSENDSNEIECDSISDTSNNDDSTSSDASTGKFFSKIKKILSDDSDDK